MLKYRGGLIALALCVLALEAAGSAVTPPAESLYADALAKEKAVRAALAPEKAPVTVLKAVRTVVEQYELVVRSYPTSGYCDDALWQAAQLSAEAFQKFKETPDRDAAVRLLRRLAAQYPSSRFAKQVPAQLARADLRGAAVETADASAVRPPVARPTTVATPVTRPTNVAAPVTRPANVVAPVTRPANVVAPVTRPTSVAAAATPPPPPAAPPLPPAAAAAGVGPVIAAGNTGLAPAIASGIATIRDIRRTVLPDVVRITIELDTEVRSFHEERLEDPARVFIDLTSTRAVPALVDQTLRFDGDAELVRQIRLGRHPNNTTRIVLEAGGVSSFSVYPLYSPYRLVIDCVRPAPAAPTLAAIAPPRIIASVAKPLSAVRLATPPPPLLRGRAFSIRPLTVSASTPEGTALIAHAALNTAPVIPVVAALPSLPMTPLEPGPLLPGAPSKNIAGGFSIARQLGLSVSRIVIDPGHGGHDPGAHGTGITEAELVLDVSLRLEKLLAAVPGIEVVLTRRTDEFVPLQERTAIANREGADLFLSIHANASTSKQVRGVETYFLNFATNPSAEAIAARENAASSQGMANATGLVNAILLNNKLDESRDLATMVQRAMMEKLKTSDKSLRDLGVKQAPFVVLIGAAMPSVLAEISFITNQQDSKLLRGPAYRQRIAEALFAAIRKYQTSLKSSGVVAARP